jgi:hypothetical protein
VNERPSEGEGLEVRPARRSGRRDELVQLPGSGQDYGALVRRARSRWTMTPLRGRRRAGLVRRQRLWGVAQLDANGTKEATAATFWLGDCTSKPGAALNSDVTTGKSRQTLVHTRDRVIGVCGCNG